MTRRRRPDGAPDRDVDAEAWARGRAVGVAWLVVLLVATVVAAWLGRWWLVVVHVALGPSLALGATVVTERIERSRLRGSSVFGGVAAIATVARRSVRVPDREGTTTTAA